MFLWYVLCIRNIITTNWRGKSWWSLGWDISIGKWTFRKKLQWWRPTRIGPRKEKPVNQRQGYVPPSLTDACRLQASSCCPSTNCSDSIAVFISHKDRFTVVFLLLGWQPLLYCQRSGKHRLQENPKHLSVLWNSSRRVFGTVVWQTDHIQPALRGKQQALLGLLPEWPPAWVILETFTRTEIHINPKTWAHTGICLALNLYCIFYSFWVGLSLESFLILEAELEC